MSQFYSTLLLLVFLIKNALNYKLKSEYYQSTQIYKQTKINEEDFLIDIDLTVDLDSKSVFLLKLSIGNDNKTYKVNFDTGSTLFTIADVNCSKCSSSIVKYDHNQSETYITNNQFFRKQYGIGYVYGILSSDIVSLSSEIPSFRLDFLLCDEYPFEFDGIIGFQHNPQEKSFVDVMYSEKIIKKRLISQFILNDNQNKALLTIGEYPSILKERICEYGNEDFINKCEVYENSTHWQCRSSEVSVLNNKNEIEILPFSFDFIFDTGSSHNYISKKIFDYFSITIFKESINNNICHIQKISNRSMFLCNDKIFSQFKRMSLYFGLYKLELEGKEMFEEIGNGQFMFIFVGNKKSSSSNILGMASLKHFIIVFDSDEHVIKFNRLDELLDLFN